MEEGGAAVLGRVSGILGGVSQYDVVDGRKVLLGGAVVHAIPKGHWDSTPSVPTSASPGTMRPPGVGRQLRSPCRWSSTGMRRGSARLARTPLRLASPHQTSTGSSGARKPRAGEGRRSSSALRSTTKSCFSAGPEPRSSGPSYGPCPTIPAYATRSPCSSATPARTPSCPTDSLRGRGAAHGAGW